MLNPNSPIPLYRQLADLLANHIGQGRYHPGDRIPSEPQLANTYGIGRPTVRQAIDALVRKGMLYRRRGSGTFVREPVREIDLFSLDGTITSFQKKGVTVATRILQPVSLKMVQKSEENPFNGLSAYFLTRLTLADQIPVLVEELYLHAELFAGLDRLDLQGRSLSAIADHHYFLRPIGGRQTFDIGYLKEEKAHCLQVSSVTPVLHVRRYLHFKQMENAVFTELWCRTDQFVFSQNIGGQPDV